MNTGKLIAAAASIAIVAVMGYMLLNEASSSKTVDKSDVKADIPADQSNADQKVVLSEEEKTIQGLKESTQPKEYEVSSLYMRKCSACHGSSGRGIVGPNLVGKTEQEILNKLHDYKQEKVKNSLMKGIFANSTEEELSSLAIEISKFGK